MNAKRKGMALEAKILTDLLNCDCAVSTPWGDTERYDLIADVDGTMLRIQVKASRTRNNGDTFEFDCRSNQYTSKGIKHMYYSADDIEYFATAFGDQSYLVPISECDSAKCLRVVKSKNNQQRRISSAAEYELEKVIENIRKGGVNNGQAGGI